MSLDVITAAAFGRRPVTRAQIEAQISVRQARARAAETGRGAGAVHKWTLLRQLGEIREGLGVSDRALGVLSALLSFHPETALTLAPDAGSEAGAAASLVVFPSNKALALRCNGMSEATLRRHLAALVEAGLIIRRDSPNGKRFARRDAEGEGAAQIYGFDRAPLAARAAACEAMAEDVRCEQRRARALRERVNLLRRELTKRLAFALDEGLPGAWEPLRLRFLDLCTPLRRLRDVGGLSSLAHALERLLGDANDAMEAALRLASSNTNSQGDAAQSGRRMTESNPDHLQDSEPASEEAGADRRADHVEQAPAAMAAPLGLVREACRDLADYDFAGDGLSTWRGFANVAATVRPMLGISPDAWREAVETLGEREAAVAVAFILQRCEHSSEARRHVGPDGRLGVTVNGSPAIRSPGGYLRALSARSRAEAKGEGRAPGFRLWPAILAHLAQRAKAERAGPS